jgi:multidrug efflux pump subunit AcrB
LSLYTLARAFFGHLVLPIFMRGRTHFLDVDYRFPLIPIGIASAITAAGIAAIVIAGADVSASAPEDYLYAQVEFDGGFRAENGDELLSMYAQKLKARNSGIKSVQTSARAGSGSVLISFDPDKIKPDEVRQLARNEPIPSGFVYIPETSANERIWKITVSGDEDEKCREIARKAAEICSGMPFAVETVLDFKDGANRLTFLPDREKLASAGVPFSEAAEEMRRGVYGPVAYKRIGAEGETDVRIRIGRETPSKDAVQGMILRGIRASDLMKGEEKPETSGIYRQDRRRVASFSIRTRPMDPRKARNSVMAALKGLDLPQGYAITFDRDAIEAAQSLSKTAIYFALALIFCYMVIAASNESFGLPLIILSVVPPSLAVPALCILLTGAAITANLAAAFIAVSGMAVNAAVLVADSLRPFPRSSEERRRAISRRLPSLLATTGTTIAGALPFLFLSEGSNGMVKTLSLVSAMGVGASCVFSLFMLPALMKIVSDRRNNFAQSKLM